MPAGKRELKSWRGWLAIAIGMSLIGGLAGCVVSAALSSIFHDGFPSGPFTGFCLPFVFAGLAAWGETKAFRLSPTRERGKVPQIVIRDRTNGRAVATVEGSSLQGASFVGVSLYSACLWGEDLSHAKFRGVDLREAMLRAAILDGADLRGASLRNADLFEARFRDADLRGADLTNTFLRTADLTGALYDQHTRWNKGFDPAKRGCVFEDGPIGLPIPASASVLEKALLPIPSANPQSNYAHLPRVAGKPSVEEAMVEAGA